MQEEAHTREGISRMKSAARPRAAFGTRGGEVIKAPARRRGGNGGCEPITMLFADASEGLCGAVRLFASDGCCPVELCAAVRTGDEVLEQLHAGLRPKVLVLDSLIQKCSIFYLLEQIRAVDPGYRPTILLTCVMGAGHAFERLLTSGADYAILKPYMLDELFATVIKLGGDGEEWLTYRVRERLGTLMAQLMVSRKMYGLNYLEQIICRILADDKAYTAEELYQLAAEAEQVSPGAIASAIRRIGAAMRRGGTARYAALCAANGKPAGAHLTNTELLYAVAGAVRRMMQSPGRLDSAEDITLAAGAAPAAMQA